MPDITEAEAPKDIVQRFWETMQTNDFIQTSLLLAEDYVLRFPQSNETFRGRANFVRFNQSYPANGRWQFTVHQLIAEGQHVVSDVSVTDSVVEARVISIAKVERGLITEQLEFWPEPFDPPEWRRAWTEGG